MASHSSKIERDAAVGLYREGYKVDEIATGLDRSLASVYLWLRKHGVILRTTPNWSKYRKVAHKRNQLISELAELKG